MKKVICLIAGILTLPAVSAEEIMIGGKAYPLVIILPLLLILLVWAVLFVSYLRNNVHKISLIIYNLRRYLRKIGLDKISDALKDIKLPKKPLEEDKKKPEKDLASHQDNLSKFENLLPRMKPEEGFMAFNELARKFFADLLGMHYEFTDEELIAELQKTMRGLVKFASRMSYIKYSGRTATKDEIIDLLDEYKYIVESNMKKNNKKASAATRHNIISKIIEEDKRIFENIREYLGFLKNENRKKHIENLLNEERATLKNNIKSMKSTYNRILNMYVQLTPQERTKIYPHLMEFYNEVNKAIFSSVYGEESKKHLIAMQKELLRISKLPKKIPIADKIRKSIDTLFPRRMTVTLPPPTAPKAISRRTPEKGRNIFAIIKSLFKIEAKAKHRHIVKGEDLQIMHKRPKTVSDLKKEEEESIGSIRRLILEDKKARSKKEEIAQEMSMRRKERASLKKSNAPLTTLHRLEPSAVPNNQPKQREGYLARLFAKKQEEPKPAMEPEMPAIKKNQGPNEAQANKMEEEKELLMKIDSMVKESSMQKQKENYLKDKIANAQQMIGQNNLKPAKKCYENLKPLFYSLPNESKREVYPLLAALQRQIAALELKNKEETEHSLEKEERLLLEKMRMLR